MTSGPITTELRADTFQHWLAIATQASEEAEAARAVAVGAALDDNETFSDALEREFRASMIAVTASAFALDAFYGSIVEHAPEVKIASRSRDGGIFETLKRAFAIDPKQLDTARAPLKTLFRLRDLAVHPPAQWVAPALHPVFNLGMEPRFVNFRSENAVSAQLVARRIIWACLRQPNPKYAALAEWCEALKDTVPEPPSVAI